jgi:hypothetical protein
MRRLKQLAPTVLVLAALAVAGVTLLTDHKSDFGTVPMPAGGSVDLPKGSVEVYYEDPPGQEQSNKLTDPVSFEVTPSGGGAPVAIEPTAKDGTSETQVQRSEDITSLGSIAKLDVPEAGTYFVRVSSGTAGASLDFGMDRFGAVAGRWELYAVLVGAALLIMLLPTSRRRGGGEEEELSWSSDARTPYATNR